MKKPFISKEMFAAMNNIGVNRLNEQYKDNATEMRKYAAKAKSIGKKVRGLTADEWTEKAVWFEQLASK